MVDRSLATTAQPPFDTTPYERMLDAPDLKAFVEELEARRRPGDGLIAFEVRLYCGIWQDAKRAMAVPGLTPGVPASRRDAVQAELNRCAGFFQSKATPFDGFPIADSMQVVEALAEFKFFAFDLQGSVGSAAFCFYRVGQYIVIDAQEPAHPCLF